MEIQTVDSLIESITTTFSPSYMSTDEGKAHFNRVGKSVTNESLIQRKKSQRETLANVAFNKALAKVASDPAKVADMLARKPTWIADYIFRKYDTDED